MPPNLTEASMLPNGQMEMEDAVREHNLALETVQNHKAVYSGQHGKLMALFRNKPGEWIALPDILATGVAQYNARLLELRRMGEQIENRTEWVNGARHSWFRWTGRI